MSEDKVRGKGFSGLLDLASDVSSHEEPLYTESKAEAGLSVPEHSHPSQQEVTSSKSGPKTTRSAPPSDTTGPGGNGSSGTKWFWGIVSVLFVIWLVNHEDKSHKKPSYNPPSSSQNYNSQNSLASAVPSVSAQGAELQYTMPSVGKDNVLSVPEIRWCFRESIRIEAMREFISTKRGVENFNHYVDEYNSRCGIYRYKKGSQSQASRDVEQYRNQIVAEAIRDVVKFNREN